MAERTTVTITGLPEVQKFLASILDPAALRIATGEIMLAVKAAAREESSGPARWVNGVNFPRPGGPGIVTGDHRQSIHVEGPRQSSTKVLVGEVVADSDHSAFLERGTRRMPPYPFLAPAVRRVGPKVGGIFLGAWTRARL